MKFYSIKEMPFNFRINCLKMLFFQIFILFSQEKWSNFGFKMENDLISIFAIDFIVRLISFISEKF